MHGVVVYSFAWSVTLAPVEATWNGEEKMNKHTKDKRISRTEKAFKNAFVELCSGKSFSDITVADLVERSGYSRSAFYDRFETRDEFVERLIDDEVETYVELSISALVHGRITQETILPLFNNVYEKRALYRLLFGEPSSLPFSDFSERVCAKVVESKLASPREPYANSSIDLDMSIYTATQKYFAYIKYWIKNDFCFSPEHMARQNEIFDAGKTSNVIKFCK